MRTLTTSLLFCAFACSRAPAELDRQQSAVLNGEDGRLEAFQVPAEVRDPLLGSSAALVYTHHLLEDARDSVSLRAPPLSAAVGLCDDEPFASQPSAAFCSGVLIDDDLLATAGHCLGADAERAADRCHDLRIVFGYALSAPEQPIELDPERVFACRRIVALDHDLAVIQLDRPGSEPLSPRPVAKTPAAVGDTLVVATHSAGLPLKIELAAEVTEISSESRTLTVAMDTFAGSSGGGLYNAALELEGLVTNGDVDWEVIDGCSRAAHSTSPREHAINADPLVTRAVCAAGWPSPRLCGTQPSCGDGLCNDGEALGCAEDCPPVRCGDSLCEPAERGICQEDCWRYQNVPETWLDDPASHPSSRSGGSASSPASTGCAVSARADTSSLPGWLSLLVVLFVSRRSRTSRR